MPTETTQIQPAWLNAQCPREGRYVLGPLLGRGGMGHVYEAWDVVLCRTVALKILKNIDPPALIRFMHEAQIHARLVHPNICRIYDVDNHDGALRVAMQMVRGDSLEQGYQALNQAQVVTIMAQVAEAVHVVHRLNLVHRDLKPSNILLERDPAGTWVPFLCDFGLAMALDEPALTFSRTVMGTPAYMAPEQFQGERRRISASTDVYALGGTLYFALTGHLSAGPTGTRSAAAAENPHLPRDLKAIIARCMQADPEARYPTANALAEDLWRFRAGEPVQATRTRRLVGLRRRLARPGLLPLALGALLLPLLCWLAILVDWHQDHGQVRLAQDLLLEASTAAADLRLEQTLPVHDLRPSYTRLRLQMEHQRQPLAGLDKPWQGQGHTVRGIMACLMGDSALAQAELERAVADGCRSLEVASCLAEAAIGLAAKDDREAEYRTGQMPTGPDPRMQRTQILLDQTRGDSQGGADEYASALAAFIGRDYLQAAAASHSSALATPWRSQAAVLEADSLATLARQDLQAGHAVAAHERLAEALAAAKRARAAAQSDPAAHHAYFQAARGLTTLEQAMGSPDLDWLGRLQTESELALVLDPENPELQDDWLAFHWLRAMQILDQGGNPGALLEEAQAFLATRAREPLGPELQADRMIIYWLMAERHLRLGGDPGPDLAQALKGAGHTPFLLHDYLQDLNQLRDRLQPAPSRRPPQAQARPAAKRIPAMDVVSARDWVRLLPTVRRSLQWGQEQAARRDLEAANVRLSSLLRTVLDASSEGILVTGLAGQITAYNRKFLTLCGIPDYVLAPMQLEQMLQFLRDQFLDSAAFMREARSLARTGQAVPWYLTEEQLVISDKALPLLGLTAETLPRDLPALEALIHPADLDGFHRALERPGKAALELSLRRGDGAWLRTRWTLKRCEDGYRGLFTAIAGAYVP